MSRLGPVVDGTQYVTTENGPRPAGAPDECFYCHRPVGGLHCEDCVCVSRKAAVRLVIEYEIDVPAHWDEKMILFHRNEGTWCATNALSELERAFGADDGPCLCGNARFEVIEYSDDMSAGVL